METGNKVYRKSICKNNIKNFIFIAVCTVQSSAYASSAGDLEYQSITKTLRISTNNTIRRIEQYDAQLNKDDVSAINPIRIRLFTPYERFDSFKAYSCVKSSCSDLSFKNMYDESSSSMLFYLERFPELNKDSSFVYSFETTNEPIIADYFFDILSLEEQTKAYNVEYFIYIPSSKDIFLKTLSETGRTVVSETDGEKKYALKLESDSDGGYVVSDTVLVSSSLSWQKIGMWMARQYKSNSKVGPRVNKWIISKKFNSNKTKSEFIKDILLELKNDISLGLTEKRHPYIPESAENIIKNRNGDCKDLVVLMTSILRAYGIITYPILTNSSNKYNFRAMLPSPFYFDHAILYVPKQDLIKSPMYIDPYDFSFIEDEHNLKYKYGLALELNNVRFIENDEYVNK